MFLTIFRIDLEHCCDYDSDQTAYHDENEESGVSQSFLYITRDHPRNHHAQSHEGST